MTIKKLNILFTHFLDTTYLCRCQIKFTTNMRLDREILSLNVWFCISHCPFYLHQCPIKLCVWHEAEGRGKLGTFWDDWGRNVNHKPIGCRVRVQTWNRNYNKKQITKLCFLNIKQNWESSRFRNDITYVRHSISDKQTDISTKQILNSRQICISVSFICWKLNSLSINHKSLTLPIDFCFYSPALL